MRIRFVWAYLAALAALPALVSAGTVNINRADAETLAAELEGIGLARAKAIVEYRDENGPFVTPDELMLVKGVGARTVELNRANILVEEPQP